MTGVCPLLEDCEAATSREMCAHFTDKAGVNWCDYFDFSPVNDPVETGQVVEVEIDGIDDRGNGLGRTSEGFVVRVDGGIPGKTAKVKIKTVYDNSAKAELVEFTGDIEDDEDETEAVDEEEDDEPRSGARGNWYGS
ncbi:TRAM domain-containing protein [Haladaptatus sp. F3-133]|jgi:predicted RNA-binding protein with TRAM domain|uniref:TRAM domain-containing protein n=1 Tax=Halorutilus salinus TaxID=2487751 RepID=A0A9Q4C3V0_9EURY|nr:TRAM domain-containing protein [Halorutilus salinus]MCX2818591.1 TRAM domain-containing protein [Halorutilus salinus]